MLWASLGQADSWCILPIAVEGMGAAFTPAGVLETYVDTGRASAVLSTGQRDGQDGYSVPNFSKLAFIKPEMFFSFVDLFTLAWLFVY